MNDLCQIKPEIFFQRGPSDNEHFANDLQTRAETQEIFLEEEELNVSGAS